VWRGELGVYLVHVSALQSITFVPSELGPSSVVELQLARRRRVPELLPTTHHLVDLVNTTLLLL
jgi:hypothetical protein